MPRRGDESVQALEWAYGVLTSTQAVADALQVPLSALPEHVWQDPAPPEAVEPLVVLSASDALDTNGLGPAPRIKAAVPLLVRVVVRGTSYQPAVPVVQAIYARMHAARSEPVAGGGTMLTCQRVSGVAYPETASGVQYRHLGHQFQVEID